MSRYPDRRDASTTSILLWVVLVVAVLAVLWWLFFRGNAGSSAAPTASPQVTQVVPLPSASLVVPGGSDTVTLPPVESPLPTPAGS
jgi:cytoskeletal protein RodZ